MKIEENITAKVTQEEILDLVRENLEQQGYEVKSIQFNWETGYQEVGQFPFTTREAYRKFEGIKAEVIRK